VAGLGTTLYLLLFNVIDLKPSPAMLNAYVALSIAMSLGGLVTSLVGAVTWARRAPRRHVLLAVAAISLVGVLLVIFGNVNIHDETAILMFVIMAAVVGVGLLLITMFVERR
jgi:FtsH-binding integral membrane protein